MVQLHKGARARATLFRCAALGRSCSRAVCQAGLVSICFPALTASKPSTRLGDKRRLRQGSTPTSAARPQASHVAMTARTPFWRMLASVIGSKVSRRCDLPPRLESRLSRDSAKRRPDDVIDAPARVVDDRPDFAARHQLKHGALWPLAAAKGDKPTPIRSLVDSAFLRPRRRALGGQSQQP
jgi:hypothetical protein